MWTRNEDEILMKEYGKLGGKWDTIAAILKNKTANGVKNRFNMLNKKQISLVNDQIPRATKKSLQYVGKYTSDDIELEK